MDCLSKVIAQPMTDEDKQGWHPFFVLVIVKTNLCQAAMVFSCPAMCTIFPRCFKRKSQETCVTGVSFH